MHVGKYLSYDFKLTHIHNKSRTLTFQCLGLKIFQGQLYRAENCEYNKIADMVLE